MSATAVEPEVTPEENEWLMQRLRPLADDPEARTKFLRAAIEAIDEAHARGEYMDVEQFGSTGHGKSQPLDVARASFQQITLKNGTSKAKAYRRWYVVLSLLGANTNGHGPSAHAEPDTEAEQIEGQELKRIADLEAALAAAENVRKLEKERADKLESNNRVLKGRVTKAEAAANEAQAEGAAGAKATTRGLRATITRQKGQLEELAAVKQLLSRVAGSESKPANVLVAQLLGADEEEEKAVVEPPREGGFRDELGTYLIQLLGTTEFGESPPQWLLDRIDRLAGI